MTRKKHIITLKKMPETNSGTANGSVCQIPAVLAGEIRKQYEHPGGSRGRRIYLLSAEEVLPAPGDIIADAEREFEITEVLICRDLDGKIRAARCTTLN